LASALTGTVAVVFVPMLAFAAPLVLPKPTATIEVPMMPSSILVATGAGVIAEGCRCRATS
jgi:hypothetical protein